MKTFLCLTFASVFLLGGCANTTTVQPAATSKSGFEGAVFSGRTLDVEPAVVGAEKFRVFQQGATGFVSVQNVRADVESIATDFCGRKSKAMHAVSETVSVPPHILGNFPRLELTFQCVDRPDVKPAGPSIGKYESLASLKKLLESGAVTQLEFDAEKAKILAAP